MIKQAFCTVAKRAFLDGRHREDDTYRLALYNGNASLGQTTAKYTTKGEVKGGGYTAGGAEIERKGSGMAKGSAWIDFGDVAWPQVSIRASGALLYNERNGLAVAVLDFGKEFTAENGRLAVEMPGKLVAIL